MSDQDGRQVAEPPYPFPDDTEGWKAYWQAKGQRWRTRPLINKERRDYLDNRRRTPPNIKQGLYPFKDGEPKLTRADIEWLLATHESGGIYGPVDLSDERQRERGGLDLRGAHLEGEDLSGLPLARLRGGLTLVEWPLGTKSVMNIWSFTIEQKEAAAVCLQETDLACANLQEATLTEANLQEADVWGANLQEARLEGTQLKGADLQGVTLGNEKQVGPRFADSQWDNVNLAIIKWSQVKILGDEYAARQKRDSGGMKAEWLRLDEYEEAVRANRQLAIALRNQGLNETSDRFAYRAHVLQWHVLHRQLPEQLEEVQSHSQQQGTEQQNSNEGETFNLPGLFAELLDWPSSLLLEVAHPLQKTPLLEIFLLALQLLAIVYLVVSPLFLFLFLLISLPFICVWFLELLFSLVARLFPRWLAKQGHKQPRLQPLPLPLTREQFKTSVSSVKRHARVLSTMFLETLKVHFSSLGSLLLDLLAGHGYKSGRTVIWYLLTIGGFAWAYFHLGPTEGHLFSPSGALVFSVTSFHGRGFFPGTLNLEDTITQLAAEAVIGFFIEISFIATFTQRFFGK